MSVAPAQKTEPNAARKLVTRAVVVTALMLGALGVSAAPAMAADYNVDEQRACQMQYGGPQYYPVNKFRGAYGWMCYYNTYGVPLAVTVTPVGGLNMQAYCSKVYPGSRALVPNWWQPAQWACRK